MGDRFSKPPEEFSAKGGLTVEKEDDEIDITTTRATKQEAP
jgi:hypothetical protein